MELWVNGKNTFSKKSGFEGKERDKERERERNKEREREKASVLKFGLGTHYTVKISVESEGLLFRLVISTNIYLIRNWHWKI